MGEMGASRWDTGKEGKKRGRMGKVVCSLVT